MKKQATGVLVVHSAPRALCSHIEWAVNALIGAPLKYRWKPQPLDADLVRVEVFWHAREGTAARIASELRGWEQLRFEVVEDPSAGALGTRHAHTPGLGLHTVAIDAAGSAMLSEIQLETLLTPGQDAQAMRSALDALLGGAWDRELEPFRAAAYDGSIALLHGVG
jgi:hypothetical protein